MVVAIVGAGSCSASDDGSPDAGLASPTTAPSGDELPAGDDGLAELVEGFVGDRDGGVAVLVTRDGQTTTLAAGAADSTETPIGPNDAFRVGSLSKPFVATMVLQLVDEGRISLDDRLGQHLPDAAAGADVTIEQLLGHRSGLPNYTDQPAFFADSLADPQASLGPDEILAYIRGVEPGAVGEFAYSNTNYIVLGQLVEHLDGVDLNTSLTTRITGPLGLSDTHFETPEQPGSVVAGWSPPLSEGDPAADYSSISTGAWAAGALVSTTSDLAHFLEALLAGELTSAASLQAMTDTTDTGYGLGLFEVAFGPGHLGYGHSGAIPGYSATMATAPDTGDTIVVLTNNDALVADILAPRLVR